MVFQKLLNIHNSPFLFGCDRWVCWIGARWVSQEDLFSAPDKRTGGAMLFSSGQTCWWYAGFGCSKPQLHKPGAYEAQPAFWSPSKTPLLCLQLSWGPAFCLLLLLWLPLMGPSSWKVPKAKQPRCWHLPNWEFYTLVNFTSICVCACGGVSDRKTGCQIFVSHSRFPFVLLKDKKKNRVFMCEGACLSGGGDIQTQKLIFG